MLFIKRTYNNVLIIYGKLNHSVHIHVNYLLNELWCLSPLSTIFQLYRGVTKETCCKSRTNFIT